MCAELRYGWWVLRICGVFENNHHLFVTTGIGTSILPFRFGVTPEIVLLTVI
jgi:predicted MPP superfamily phosphohydrolase